MNKVSKEQYEFALARVEELLPLVDDNTPANDKNAVELTVMSDIVIAYEKEHYPIEKPTVAELIELSLEEKGMSQKQLAGEIGISPSRVNDYISGRSEPTLKIARLLCRVLNIPPAADVGSLISSLRKIFRRDSIWFHAFLYHFTTIVSLSCITYLIIFHLLYK